MRWASPKRAIFPEIRINPEHHILVLFDHSSESRCVLLRVFWRMDGA